MEIKIDESVLAESINESATMAIKESLTGYTVRSSITEALTSEIVNGVLATATGNAIARIDTEALTQSIVDEIQKAMLRATVLIIEDGITALVCKMRGIGDFSLDDKEERARIRKEFSGVIEGNSND